VRLLIERLPRTLAAIEVTRTLLHLLCIGLGWSALAVFMDVGYGLFATTVAGWLVLWYLFEGLMPRCLMPGRALHAIIKHTLPFVVFMERILRPLTFLMVTSLSAKKKPAASESAIISKDPADEKEMLEEIIHFYNKRADEIMVPRMDLEAIDMESSLSDLLKLITRTGFSRIPVYKDTEDNIKGILYGKDLFPAIENPSAFRWQELIRPAYFVPEAKKIDDLLEEFRSNRVHIAIVVDEFGCTSGLVTMEDIIEEIIGEISDEYDDDEKLFVHLRDGSYIFEGKIQLNDFFRETGIDPTEFGELTEEVETLAGLLLEIKGTLPSRREVIDYKRYRFRILEANERRLLKIKFSIIEQVGKKE
jgi:CBS domain containing-hemolysin-like protein